MTRTDLQRYADFSPIAVDTKGLGLEDRQDWFVAPVSQTRDSEALSRSNFRVVLADLGGESDDVEVHRFGHWGPGWFEIIIVKPDTDAARKAASWADALNDYPVADETDFSNEESEDMTADWNNWLESAVRRAIDRLLDSDVVDVDDCCAFVLSEPRVIRFRTHTQEAYELRDVFDAFAEHDTGGFSRYEDVDIVKITKQTARYMVRVYTRDRKQSLHLNHRQRRRNKRAKKSGLALGNAQ